ncbi:acylneuraminate cytidylyltransferase [Galbitalea soli]|uniref:acylneuraminate cytidylyltransferase n=1 Tax=Galbitalea soli TaxID=1268042 RepID=UPI00178D083C|nr:N-acylneuraminate cytidylyltransferase [Galbitalea soli]
MGNSSGESDGGQPVSVVAIIPARGGAVGRLGADLVRVGGATLIARAIRAARGSAAVDRVVVSTDDPVVAAEARASGAEVLVRPAELAAAPAGVEQLLLQVLDALGEQPGILVVLQSTSPFIAPTDLDAAITRVAARECDVVLSAVPTRSFLWRAGARGLEPLGHSPAAGSRREEAPAQFEETGAFAVLDARGFRRARHLRFGTVAVQPVDPRRAMEVVDDADLSIAQALAPVFASDERVDVDALVTDFDGVHTDDRVSIGGDGLERVTTSRSDGMGMEFLRTAGYPLLIVSKETNRVVTARARKLHVDVRQGVDDKAAVLEAWAKTRGLSLDRIAYIGNDLNDLASMGLVGWPVAVADAHPEVIRAARIVLTRPGGHGAIREFAERMLRTRTAASGEGCAQLA